MRTLLKSWIVRALALLFVASTAFAQDRVPFRQEELDQMLAPVALYPDSLLSQMLMASTYPLEVVQAARWSRANRGLKGQDAVKAVERMDWDPSVKSLTAFPEVLAMMDEKLDWTERLGEAFLAQQQDVMNSVQGLRRRADAAGNLRSGDRMRVVREREAIVIEPPAPEVVYVPHYSPTVVYGPWWYPAYPPVYWAPPPAYYVAPAYGPAFFWGSGIGISAGFFFGHFDWPHRNVTVVENHITNVNVNRRTVINQSDVSARRTAWRHDPAHRRGVPFRSAAARERFEQSRAAADERRGAERGDGTRAERRGDENRTADVRQRRMDERSNATPGRRDDRRDAVQDRRPDRHDTAQDRRGADRPESAGNRPSLSGERADRAKSASQPDARAAQPESRRAQPEPRNAQPDRDARPGRSERSAPQAGDRRAQSETRNAQPDRDARSGRAERSAPQAADRRGENRERRDARLQARNAESRPEVAALRAEPRRPTPVANALAAPQRAFEDRRADALRNNGHMRATQEPRHVARESASASRAAASAPAPRAQNDFRGNGTRNEHARGDNGRRS